MTNNIQLTRHFNLAEFLRSPTACRYGINNEATIAIISNLQKLCIYILEPTRIMLGVHIIVTSGYRCTQLNKIVGGVANSQHTQGLAADLKTYNIKNMQKLFNLLSNNKYVDELLYETKGHSSWIHVSYSDTPRHIIIRNYKP